MKTATAVAMLLACLAGPTGARAETVDLRVVRGVEERDVSVKLAA